jgi:hypothetical protein
LAGRREPAVRGTFLKLGLGRLAGVLDGIGSTAEGGGALAAGQIGLMNGDPKTYRSTLKAAQAVAQTGLYLQGELQERAGQAMAESPIPGGGALGYLTRQVGALEKKLGGGDPRVTPGSRQGVTRDGRDG